jgi:hypothetical protein
MLHPLPYKYYVRGSPLCHPYSSSPPAPSHP